MMYSECFILGDIFAFLAVLDNIVKYNPPSILILIIFPLGNFVLIILVVGITLLRQADTDMKFTVPSESETAKFPLLFPVYFLLLALKRDYYIHMYFQCHCKPYHLGFLYYILIYPLPLFNPIF